MSPNTHLHHNCHGPYERKVDFDQNVQGDQRVVRDKKFQDLFDGRIAGMGVEPIERLACFFVPWHAVLHSRDCTMTACHGCVGRSVGLESLVLAMGTVIIQNVMICGRNVSSGSRTQRVTSTTSRSRPALVRILNATLTVCTWTMLDAGP